MTGLLFDIGGTNTRVAITADGKRFRTPTIFKTPKRFRAGVRLLTSTAERLAGSRRITVVSGGVAGTLAKNRECMINSPHLKAWIGKPIVQTLRRTFQAPVILENDSALVALGEATHGAGRGYDIVAYLTVSTGVGGARIVEQTIDKTAYGFEPGHQIIDRSGPRDNGYRLRGTLETLVSGTAIQRRFGKSPREIRAPAVWKETAKLLALGLVNLTVLWSPHVIVLGGSMLKKPGIAVSDVRTALQHDLHGFLPIPKILRATLGDFGGLYGALELLKQRLPSRSGKNALGLPPKPVIRNS